MDHALVLLQLTPAWSTLSSSSKSAERESRSVRTAGPKVPCIMFNSAIVWNHRPDAAGNPCKGTIRIRRLPRGAAVRRGQPCEALGADYVVVVRQPVLAGEFAACAGANSSPNWRLTRRD